jgi:hypothetical protein
VIVGEPVLGRQVQVRAQAQSNGELVALRLQVELAADARQKPDGTASPIPESTPSYTPSVTPTASPVTGEASDPAPVPSSTTVPTLVRPADREETETPMTSTPVPAWLQKFRRTPQPGSTRPMAVPSLTTKPQEPQRSKHPTGIASPTQQQRHQRTPMFEDTPAAGLPGTRTPMPTLSQSPSHTRQPEPARTGMPDKPQAPKPESTREPESDRPKDPRPEPPGPRPRSTKRP